MNVKDYVSYAVIPTLYYMSSIIPYSKSAVFLLTLTAKVESDLSYLHQINGPARGLLQMEPSTEQSLWTHYIRYRPAIKEVIQKLIIPGIKREENLSLNIPYQIAMSRILYYSKPEKLPSINDVDAMSNYYKIYYNTNKGKSDVNKVKQVYRDLLPDLLSTV